MTLLAEMPGMWVLFPMLSSRKQPMLLYGGDSASVMRDSKAAVSAISPIETTVAPVTQEESREE